MLHSDPLCPDENEIGQRLDAFLAARFGVSRSRAQKMLESVSVNGKAVKPSYALRAGDQVVGAALPPETPAPLPTAPTAPLPEILFEDDDLMVLNKPRGLTVHAGAGDTGETLVERLQSHGRVLSGVGPSERAGIVHRLDKDTSGVIIVCKSDAAHWKLAADFEARRVQKTYVAICCGVPPVKGRIEAPIARSLTNRKKMTVSPSGRFAITEYETEKSWARFALLSINLLTGRTHQIRAHLTYIHHPVAGDAVYGGWHRALENAPSEAVRLALENLRGQALHAARIEFEHPMNGEPMSFEAPLAPEIAAIVDALDAA